MTKIEKILPLFLCIINIYGAQQSKTLLLPAKDASYNKKVLAELYEIFNDNFSFCINDLINLIQDYALCGPTTEQLSSELFKSIELGDIDGAHVLLAAGADIHATQVYQGTRCNTREFTMRLMQEKCNDGILYDCLSTISELLSRYAYN